jgi:hypothetical protein
LKDLLIAAMGLMVFWNTSSFAAQAHRSGMIGQMQLDAHVVSGSEDVVWLQLPGNWSGTACLADWAWFNAKDNPHFLASVLTARAMSSPVDIYVDDSYVKINGTCQITKILM